VLVVVALFKKGHDYVESLVIGALSQLNKTTAPAMENGESLKESETLHFVLLGYVCEPPGGLPDRFFLTSSQEASKCGTGFYERRG